MRVSEAGSLIRSSFGRRRSFCESEGGKGDEVSHDGRRLLALRPVPLMGIVVSVGIGASQGLGKRLYHRGEWSGIISGLSATLRCDGEEET